VALGPVPLEGVEGEALVASQRRRAHPQKTFSTTACARRVVRR
jgi:hypothetical protein